MRSIRKSLNGNKDNRSTISTPTLLPPVSRPSTGHQPPQKVIKALSGYRPNAPQELGFKKGDFFYVVKDVNEGGAYYEAHNPVTGARGLVPRTMFEEFSKPSVPSVQFILVSFLKLIRVLQVYSSFTAQSPSESTIASAHLSQGPEEPGVLCHRPSRLRSRTSR